jgi:hypothetical protein
MFSDATAPISPAWRRAASYDAELAHETAPTAIRSPIPCEVSCPTGVGRRALTDRLVRQAAQGARRRQDGVALAALMRAAGHDRGCRVQPRRTPGSRLKRQRLRRRSSLIAAVILPGPQGFGFRCPGASRGDDMQLTMGMPAGIAGSGCGPCCWTNTRASAAGDPSSSLALSIVVRRCCRWLGSARPCTRGRGLVWAPSRRWCGGLMPSRLSTS